jgi:hypothetical protein
MHRRRIHLPSLLLCMIGQGCCVHYVQRTDVTADPNFQTGYRKGQVYQLKTDALLVDHKPQDEYDDAFKLIWSQAFFNAYTTGDSQPMGRFQKVATLPAGTTIVIDRLEYSTDQYTFEALCPFSMAHRLESVSAYATVSTGTNKWINVIAPHAHGSRPTRIKGTFMWPVDLDLVELVTSTSQPTGH